MKDKTISVIFFFFISFVAFEFAKMYYREKQEKQRIAQSFEAANKSLVYYKTQNGMIAARNEVLNLRFNELKDIYPKIVTEIKNLDVRPKHVTSYAETVIKQEKEFISHLKDSIIRDTIKAKVFSYRDSFYNVQGIATGDTQRVHITSRDSIIQIVYKGKRYRPWLWIFSKRRMEQVIASKNPNSTILYNHTILITSKP